ncbi:hypothetical protein FA13DRAFT_175001 [Coprinellus micaceus]|uniref:Uncharacterized protein n=1 Tax=Coprinellus micaceus TaxID=71717 RepID=A0A4Y7SGM0_COPMI|nr:hypothetical protein FA13DRAFT_175001 [Coprinellus micaceus]
MSLYHFTVSIGLYPPHSLYSISVTTMFCYVYALVARLAFRISMHPSLVPFSVDLLVFLRNGFYVVPIIAWHITYIYFNWTSLSLSRPGLPSHPSDHDSYIHSATVSSLLCRSFLSIISCPHGLLLVRRLSLLVTLILNFLD